MHIRDGDRIKTGAGLNSRRIEDEQKRKKDRSQDREEALEVSESRGIGRKKENMHLEVRPRKK